MRVKVTAAMEDSLIQELPFDETNLNPLDPEGTSSKSSILVT